MLYGLSLSLCVREILAGEASEESVTAIIGATKFDSPESAVKHYSGLYWREYDQEEVMALVTRLWPKVVQPRLHGYEPHNIADGHWLDESPVMIEGEWMHKWVKPGKADPEEIIAKMDGATFIPLED